MYLFGIEGNPALMKKILFTLSAFLICASLTRSATTNGKPISMSKVFHQTVVNADKQLGTPKNIGRYNKFREYEVENAGVFCSIQGSKVINVVVTSRIPFSSPIDAAASVGIDLSGTNPVSKNITAWVWKKIDAFPVVTVRSIDGRLWEVIEVSETVTTEYTASGKVLMPHSSLKVCKPR